MFAKSLDRRLLTRPSTDYCNIGRSRGAKLLTARWLSLPAGSKSLCRLTVAKARLLLHERTTDQDALDAIGLMNAMLDSALVDVNTNKPDVGVLYNRPLSEKGLREAALDTFKKISAETGKAVEDKVFYEEMEKLGKFTREQAEKVFQDMYKSGAIYEVNAHFFKKA